MNATNTDWNWRAIRLSRTFDLESSLESGQAFRWRRMEDADFGRYYEGVAFGNLIHVRQEESSVSFRSSPGPNDSIGTLLEDFLGLSHDIDAICEELSADHIVAAAMAEYPGMRILRQEPWECLVSFICSANNNIARISRNVEDIATEFGESIYGSDTQRKAFPSPSVIADAGEGALRELGLGFRAKYVAAAARRVAEREIDLYTLREASYEEALETVTEVPGVGDKVGNCVLLFSLDKLEAFPVDVWIDRALRDWYAPARDGKPLPKTRMREWAQNRFGRFAGYANQYLFHSRRLKGASKSAEKRDSPQPAS